MGQVPARTSASARSPYGFVGDGRLSRHWRHYFTSLGLPWSLWSRRLARVDGLTAAAALADCEVILLAVSDDAIEPVHAQLCAAGLDGRTFVHFCGGRSFPGIFGTHPLMSFGTSLYEPRFYPGIPVFAEAGADGADPVARFRSLFPRLANPCFPLAAADKAYYHALCSLAGGMTAVLWRDFFAAMESRFGAPRDALAGYPRRILENVLASGGGALTGPVARGDTGTIEAHLAALDGSTLGAVYRAFIQAARSESA
jgi:predicted short-subunit dehydrogenase-like oxidoreductase (DUF2520 family)